MNIEKNLNGNSLTLNLAGRLDTTTAYRVTHYLSLVFAQCFIVSEGVRFAY